MAIRWMPEGIAMTQQVEQLTQAVRQACKSGKPFTCEELLKEIETEEHVDRRVFGVMIRNLREQGIIVKAGYQQSTNPRHHRGIKQLWTAGPEFKPIRKRK